MMLQSEKLWSSICVVGDEGASHGGGGDEEEEEEEENDEAAVAVSESSAACSWVQTKGRSA